MTDEQIRLYCLEMVFKAYCKNDQIPPRSKYIPIMNIVEALESYVKTGKKTDIPLYLIVEM